MKTTGPSSSSSASLSARPKSFSSTALEAILDISNVSFLIFGRRPVDFSFVAITANPVRPRCVLNLGGWFKYPEALEMFTIAYFRFRCSTWKSGCSANILSCYLYWLNGQKYLKKKKTTELLKRVKYNKTKLFLLLLCLWNFILEKLTVDLQLFQNSRL